MSRRMEIRGTVTPGAGKAAYFTGLDWVQRQCLEKLHFSPYPGTLNILVEAGCLSMLDELQSIPAILFLSPDPAFCDARVVPASVGTVQGALIIPAQDVRIHGDNILEVIAPVSIKETLSLNDGDRVQIFVTSEEAN